MGIKWVRLGLRQKSPLAVNHNNLALRNEYAYVRINVFMSVGLRYRHAGHVVAWQYRDDSSLIHISTTLTLWPFHANLDKYSSSHRYAHFHFISSLESPEGSTVLGLGGQRSALSHSKRQSHRLRPDILTSNHTSRGPDRKLSDTSASSIPKRLGRRLANDDRHWST